MNGLWINPLKSAHQTFYEEGVLFYPCVLEGEELERLRLACEYVLEQYLAELDKKNDGNKNAIVMRDLQELRWHPEHKTHWKTIMEAAADPRCIGPVEQILQGPSLFRCSSLFFNPRFESFEGDWHRDSQFILKDEEIVKANATRKEIVGGLHVQLALIANDDLEYVPFSACRYDSPEEHYIRCTDNHQHSHEAGMPNAMRLSLRAGDAVIFNPTGLHRGRYLVNHPRRTLMLTYTPHKLPERDSWSRQPWMENEDFLSCLSHRARGYIKDFAQHL